jgi:hypothetical protein
VERLFGFRYLHTNDGFAVESLSPDETGAKAEA